MAQVETPPTDVTLVDLTALFGPMPAWRIRTAPKPGTATEEDVLEIEAREHRLCELVDGVLVEKTMGYWESYLAAELARVLGNFVRPRLLGIVTGEAGMTRLFPGLVRIPDAAFAAREKFPDGRVPREPIPTLVPDLVAEVLSKSNTAEEMSAKLADYFHAGVRLVWYIDPRQRTVQVFAGPTTSHLLCESDTLTGGDVLPGFALPLRDFFREPLEATPPTLPPAEKD
jgi:Uma2 family endonuclease